MRLRESRLKIVGVLGLLCFLICVLVAGKWVTESSFAGSESAEDEVFVLKDIEAAKTIVIRDDQPQVEKLTEKCTHYTCFDVYQCDWTERDRIRVYVYPIRRYVDSSGIVISSEFTEEFWQIIEAITASPYYTSDPKTACLFVPSIDLLSQSYVRLDETSQVLNSLPYWNEGKNHILFNMIPGSYPDYSRILDVNFGRALIAGGGFDSWSFRQEFDVAIPMYSPLSTKAEKEVDETNSPRKWFLTASQVDAMSLSSKIVMQKLESDNPGSMVILRRCVDNPHNSSNFRCNQKRNSVSEYPKVLRSSTFCLIVRTAYLGSPLLSEALMSGCIPVVAMDEFILPFPEVIDWKRVAVRVQENSLKDVMKILKQIAPDRLAEMQKQSHYIWKTYFSSLKAIVLTTLGIINDRLVPHTVVPKEDKNAGYSYPSQRT
ncbi:Exostosin-2 [Halotydeus destructor]|nr:Exostosin-2 [Halotydeus destructor]